MWPSPLRRTGIVIQIGNRRESERSLKRGGRLRQNSHAPSRSSSPPPPPDRQELQEAWETGRHNKEKVPTIEQAPLRHRQLGSGLRNDGGAPRLINISQTNKILFLLLLLPILGKGGTPCTGVKLIALSRLLRPISNFNFDVKRGVTIIYIFVHAWRHLTHSLTHDPAETQTQRRVNTLRHWTYSVAYYIFH